MSYFSYDDIVQVSSPPGNALVGMVRLSGRNAFALMQTLLGQPFGCFKRGVYDAPITLALERQVGPEKREKQTFPCPARLCVMPGPGSYTGEDVVEIQTPGSQPLLEAVVENLVRAGARPALPGEFTFRAFRNGRMTLGQAEAVEETIRAGTAAEARAALSRLGDSSARRIAAWRDQVFEVAAQLEAALDFNEEELGQDLAANLRDVLGELSREAGAIAGTVKTAAASLPHAALVGLANAGKSSLYNELVGDKAALVSATASTTHDHLRREVEWLGRKLILSDNPGFDPAAGGGSREAQLLAARRLGAEDLACWVIDASRAFDEELAAFAKQLSRPLIVVLNKADLPQRLHADELAAFAGTAGLEVEKILRVSTVSGQGIETVRSAVAERCQTLSVAAGAGRREDLELAAALGHCRQALEELAGPGRLELASEELRFALAAFSRALGEGYAEETLSRIFSRFCLGK